MKSNDAEYFFHKAPLHSFSLRRDCIGHSKLTNAKKIETFLKEKEIEFIDPL